MTQVFRHGRIFEKTSLIEPTTGIHKCRDRIVRGLAEHLPLTRPVKCSTGVSFGNLRAHKGDLLLWRCDASEHVGRALVFARGADGQHGAVVEEFHGAGQEWDMRNATLSVVPLDLIANLLPYISLGGSMVRVLKPFEGG